jgi:hypothetical protein
MYIVTYEMHPRQYISSDEEIRAEFVHLYKLTITATQKGLITNNAVDLEAP